MFTLGDGGGRRLFHEGSLSVVALSRRRHPAPGPHPIRHSGTGVLYSCSLVELLALFVLRFRSVDNGRPLALTVRDLENVNPNLVFVGLELVVAIVCSHGGACERDK